MIPLILYAGVAPIPGLTDGFEDFRLELASWLGYGDDATYWESNSPGSTAALQRRVNQAYKWVLYPENIPGEKINHVWTFLVRDGELTFTEDTYEYSVPADFASFHGEFMWWTSVGQSSNKIRRVDPDEIWRQRQYLQSSTTYPQIFSVDWNAPSIGSQQTQRFLFHPTPSADYTVRYRYVLNAEPLSLSNPYPLGGQRISQCVMEMCRAIGEQVANGGRGDQWGVAREALVAAITMDKHTNTSSTVGIMQGEKLRRYDPYLGESNLYDVDGSLVVGV